MKQLQASKEYHALKKALLAAGVTEDHLDTLVKSQLPPQTHASININNTNEEEPTKLSPVRPRWSAEAAVFVPRRSLSPTRKFGLKSTCNIPPTPPSYHSQSPVIEDDWCEEESEYYSNDHEDRSVTLRGFSPFTTLGDVAKIVHGGIVLNMFLRSKERSAHVAFVDPMAAEKFVMHYKRNDLYVKGKRIDVMWDEKQYTMSGHIQRQIYNNGATRNIVIRFAKKDMTPETVREDLEHIHRLEVVDIFTTENHIFISTNSIQHAITARHCMQSRLKYKGSRIEFFEDECDQVLPAVVKKAPQTGFEPQKRPATVAMANRFALLFEEDDELEDKDKPMRRIASASGIPTPA